jgi:hypothetical protein
MLPILFINEQKNNFERHYITPFQAFAQTLRILPFIPDPTLRHPAHMMHAIDG